MSAISGQEIFNRVQTASNYQPITSILQGPIVKIQETVQQCWKMLENLPSQVKAQFGGLLEKNLVVNLTLLERLEELDTQYKNEANLTIIQQAMDQAMQNFMKQVNPESLSH